MELSLLLIPLVTFLVVLTVSLVGNMTGIGGGVPVSLFFIYYLHLSPAETGGLSLLAIILNTLFGSISNVRSGIIDKELLIMLAIPGVIGTVLGSLLVNFVSLGTFKGLFGIFTFAIGCISLVTALTYARSTEKLRESRVREKVKHRLLTRLIAFGSGTISGLIGVGVGVQLGTWLTAGENIRVRIAFSTVILVALPITTTGVLVHFSSLGLSDPSLPYYIVPIVVGSLAGGIVGSRLLRTNTAVKSRVIQGVAAVFLGGLSLALYIITTTL